MLVIFLLVYYLKKGSRTYIYRRVAVLIFYIKPDSRKAIHVEKMSESIFLRNKTYYLQCVFYYSISFSAFSFKGAVLNLPIYWDVWDTNGWCCGDLLLLLVLIPSLVFIDIKQQKHVAVILALDIGFSNIFSIF